MTKEEEEVSWLRAAFAQPDEAPNPEQCPPPERLWAAAAGELGPAEVRAVVEHLGSCAACAEEWRLAVELGNESAEAASAFAVEPSTGRQAHHPPRAMGWRRSARWLSAAAAAALIGAVGLNVYQSHNRLADSVVRGERAAIELFGEDGATLDRQHLRLSWRAVVGARSYEIEIQNPTGEVLFRRDLLTDPEVEIPASSLSALPPSSLLYWRVTANLETGASIDSDPRRFRLQ